MDPDELSIIHVAGTKGKGSTCAIVDSILRRLPNSGAVDAEGSSRLPRVKMGLFTSPHLVDVRERIRISGVPISRAAYLRSFWYVHDRLQAAEREV